MLCTIWYHLYSLKNVKNTRGEVLLLVKLQAEACNFTKSNRTLLKVPNRTKRLIHCLLKAQSHKLKSTDK